MSAPSFWLRCETKQFERRAALTPTTAKKLIDAGFEIVVERDDQRIFNDAEYEAYAHISSLQMHTVTHLLPQCWLQACREQLLVKCTCPYAHPWLEGITRLRRAD